MNIKENCAFYDKEKKECSILIELYCKKCKYCAFYKTKEQEDRNKRKYGYKIVEE